MIPKIIHYCWFGKKLLPKSHIAYIDGWKRILTDYDFVLWNEKNFDVNTTLFTKQIASTGKWGFIVDYIRGYAVYNYGGIYMDTDVELLQPVDDLLINQCCGGFNDLSYINPGTFFAGEKGCIIAKDIIDYYSNHAFIRDNGSLNIKITGPKVLTDILLQHGLKRNNEFQILDGGIFTVYPPEYFEPKSLKTKQLKITANTRLIHHFEGSWKSKSESEWLKRRDRHIKKYGYKIGSIIGLGILFFLCVKNKEINVFISIVFGAIKYRVFKAH
jgi:mannosyltransferase OCH1-like enzyme